MLVFEERGLPEYPEKTPRCRTELLCALWLVDLAAQILKYRRLDFVLCFQLNSISNRCNKHLTIKPCFVGLNLCYCSLFAPLWFMAINSSGKMLSVTNGITLKLSKRCYCSNWNNYFFLNRLWAVTSPLGDWENLTGFCVLHG